MSASGIPPQRFVNTSDFGTSRGGRFLVHGETRHRESPGGSMFRNVMVPVDGSPFSREAVLQGLRLASVYGATLRLVRVASGPSFSVGTDAASGLAAADAVHATELSELYSIAAECRAHSTLNITATLERGPVVDALRGYARRNGVDVIVMRSHARHGLARAWFGSVADALIRQSGIPVLIVRPPSVATGLERNGSYRRIVVPLDGSLLAEQALPMASSLARCEHATILLLFVFSAASDGERHEVLSPIGSISQREVSEVQAYLDNVVLQYGTHVQMMTRIVVATDVPSAILRAAEADESDLIAMSSRGRGMMARTIGGSVSDRVMRESAISTLVIHPVAPYPNKSEVVQARSVATSA
ncbi:MAG: universal stress protein [Thermoanaerobaculia bacterium]